MEYKLEEFQEKFISKVSSLVKEKRSIIAQSITGSGKTVIFSSITQRFIEKGDRDVVIFVHREELLNQTRKALYDWYGIISQKIDAETKIIDSGTRVFVAMIETFNNRAKNARFLDRMNRVGLVIIDEAHLGNFTKIIVHFPEAYRIGFTATPISAKKKEPLNGLYRGIVCGVSVKELIKHNQINPTRGVVPADEYSFVGIDRNNIKKNKAGDEFDENDMGEKFSSKEQIQNTLNAYITKGIGKKTLIFNSSVEHSKKVNQAFIDAGFNSRHLDGGSDKSYRKDCFEWLKNTPNAILNNVGIATTGFDEPSIETVILNKCVMSFTLFKQIIGRGGRPFMYEDGSFKEYFLFLDLGDNIVGGAHGCFDDDIDWEFIFNNPKLPKPGIGAVKQCPECGAINTASARICGGKVLDFLSDDFGYADCGYLFPQPTKEEDTLQRELVRITNSISVRSNIEFFKDRAEYYSMYQTIIQVCNEWSKNKSGYCDSSELDLVYDISYSKVSEWHKILGKRKYPALKLHVFDNVITNLKKNGLLIPIEEIEEVKSKKELDKIENSLTKYT